MIRDQTEQFENRTVLKPRHSTTATPKAETNRAEPGTYCYWSQPRIQLYNLPFLSMLQPTLHLYESQTYAFS
jgi:hypothetical protein